MVIGGYFKVDLLLLSSHVVKIMRGYSSRASVLLLRTYCLVERERLSYDVRMYCCQV